MLAMAVIGFAVMAYDIKHGPSGVGFAGMMTGIALVILMLVYIAMPPLLLKCERIEDNCLWITPVRNAVKESFRGAPKASGGQPAAS
jgi:hypothetical protein